MRDELHWLPVPLRIRFKLCCTVFKCLHGAAPPYLSEFCQPLSSLAGRYQLRSAAAGDLLIPPSKTVTIGRRGFSISGPAAWNGLPTNLKDPTLTFPAFKKLLKTHLFMTMWTVVMRLCSDCLKGALQIPVSIQFNFAHVTNQSTCYTIYGPHAGNRFKYDHKRESTGITAYTVSFLRWHHWQEWTRDQIRLRGGA